MSGRPALVLTCEHGGNEVPKAYGALFVSAAAKTALGTHRGYDPGALTLARSLAGRFRAPFVANMVTRLLVELNRSVGHRRLFSEFSTVLDPGEREALVDRYYRPHRATVLEAIERASTTGDPVLHVGVHTFTPELEGRPRTADVGLLYDPARPGERELCARWKRLLERAWPGAGVRRNYPYLGKDDGLTTELRARLPADRYLGIELEVNNTWLVGPRAKPEGVARMIGDSLEALLG